MKDIFRKISEICTLIFGYGIMIVLFAGGFTFFGYLAALLIGGPAAEAICIFIYKTIIPVIVYTSTILVLLGILCMYLTGEMALTIKKKRSK